MDITSENHLQAIDSLRAAGVHLVRHGGRSHLALRKSLRRRLGPRHQADRTRQVGHASPQLIKTGNDLEVEASRIDLAGGIQGLFEAEVFHEALLQLCHLVCVTIEQGELVETGADGAL